MLSSKQVGTYGKKVSVIGITALLSTFFGVIVLLSPTSVRAVWPFTSALAADGDAPILHDASMRLLAAALNTDPNPVKDAESIFVTDDSALVATSGLEGSVAAEGARTETNSANSTGSISVYTVKEGDSISSIADHFGVSVNTILWANDLTIRSTIRSGMNLVILPVSGVKHIVAKGETLSNIASAHHASAAEVATFNGLDEDATVVVGSTLIIPGGENSVVTAKPAAAKKAAASAKTTSTKTVAKSTAVRADLGTASAGSGYYSNPVPGAILYQGIHGNNGVDLSAPSGTPIHAAAAGTVIISKGDAAWNGGYGSYAVVSHANGTQTLYSHMSKDVVTVGETVAAGQLLGYVGETGEATGNHLHFEVRGAKNWLAYSCTIMRKCY